MSIEVYLAGLAGIVVVTGLIYLLTRRDSADEGVDRKPPLPRGRPERGRRR